MGVPFQAGTGACVKDSTATVSVRVHALAGMLRSIGVQRVCRRRSDNPFAIYPPARMSWRGTGT